MKKALRWTGIVVGVILVLLGGVVGYFWFSDLPHYDVAKVEANVEITPARVERGRKLVSMTCADCHMDPTTNQLTGRPMPEFPAAFGQFWSQNITNDPTYGIGKWSDGDLVRLFRTGIHPSGRLLVPFMTRPAMSDEDLNSLIAYLRSDHEWVRANPKPDTALVAGLIGKVIMAGFDPYPLPTKPVPPPDTTDKIKWGRYLVANMGCGNCHSNSDAPDLFVPEKTENFLSGGHEMGDGHGGAIIPPNISSSKQHGIGKWSELQFVRVLRDGFRPNGQLARPPMPRFNELSYEEMQAIFTYILSMPPNETPNVVAESSKASVH
jgi:mono/diheme cytochrome c family protein